MTLRVRVAQTDEDFVSDTISVFIGERTDSGVSQWFADGTVRFTAAHEASVQPVPSLRIREDHARALLGELQRYFQGGDDMRALRADYNHERTRVDKLTDALIAITTGGGS